MENIILKKWNYVDLLINSQVIRLGRLESIDTQTILAEKGLMYSMLWFF
jgi:hypothetical protein